MVKNMEIKAVGKKMVEVYKQVLAEEKEKV